MLDAETGTYTRIWVADGSGSWYAGNAMLANFSGEPPVYDGKPYHPGSGKPIDPTKHPVFRGGESFEPRLSETPDPVDGKIPLGKPKGVSVNTDPDNKNVKPRGPRQIAELPPELEIVQQGQDPGHAVIRPKVPLTPEEYKDALEKIKTKEYVPPPPPPPTSSDDESTTVNEEVVRP